MARKQSSKIYFQGKYHNEIYFQGHYHDKMYIGDQLVWEKLAESDNILSVICDSVFNNDYYAYGRIQERDTETNGYIDTYRVVIAKYDYKRRVFKKICQVNDSIIANNAINIIASDDGFLFEIYKNQITSYKFCDKNGKSTELPSDEIQFMINPNHKTSDRNKIFTNKGIISFSNGVGFTYKDYDGNTISSLPYKFEDYSTEGGITIYNGELYAYRSKYSISAGMIYIETGKVIFKKEEIIEFNALVNKTYTYTWGNRKSARSIKNCKKHGIIVIFTKIGDTGSKMTCTNINQETLYDDIDTRFNIFGETEDYIIFGASHGSDCILKKGQDGEEIQYENRFYKSGTYYDPIYVLYTDKNGEEHVFNRNLEIYEDGTIDKKSYKYFMIEE